MAKTARNVVVRTGPDEFKAGTVRTITIDGEPFPYYTRGSVRIEVEKSGAQTLWVPIFVDSETDVVIETQVAS